jgi:hypothetical protein
VTSKVYNIFFILEIAVSNLLAERFCSDGTILIIVAILSISKAIISYRTIIHIASISSVIIQAALFYLLLF